MYRQVAAYTMSAADMKRYRELTAENERLRALLKNAEAQLHAYVAPHGAPVSAVTRLIVDEIRATFGTE
jgi:hypothetical protein